MRPPMPNVKSRLSKLLPLEASDAPEDLTLLHSLGLVADQGSSLNRLLGDKMVKLVVFYNEEPTSTTDYASQRREYTVHKSLLCSRSRFFHTFFNRPLNKEVLNEALLLTKKRQDLLWEQTPAHNDALPDDSHREAQYLTDVPLGYICSSDHLLKQYCSEASRSDSNVDSSSEQAPTNIVPEVHVIELLEEHPGIFSHFVHWLYTQKLNTNGLPHDQRKCVHVSLYALAERLAVPTLRQTCYTRIVKPKKMVSWALPSSNFLKILVNECSATSMLRKYFVHSFAQAILDKSTSANHDADLSQFQQFSQEIGLEIMRRLQTRIETKLPFEDEQFEADDSDPDVEDMNDSDSDTDSDCDMDLSDEEEVESDSNMDEPDEEATVSTWRMGQMDEETGSTSSMGSSDGETAGFLADTRGQIEIQVSRRSRQLDSETSQADTVGDISDGFSGTSSLTTETLRESIKAETFKGCDIIEIDDD